MRQPKTIHGVTLIYADPDLPPNSEGERIEVLWAHDLVERPNPETEVTTFLESAAWEDSWGRLGLLEQGYWTVHWAFSPYGAPYYDFELEVTDVTRTPESVIREYEKRSFCSYLGTQNCTTSEEVEEEPPKKGWSGWGHLVEPPKPPEYPKCQTVGGRFRIVPHPHKD